MTREPQRVPTIDGQRLARIRQISRYAAVIAFVIFLALIGLSAHELVLLNQRIAAETSRLVELKNELTTLQKQKNQLDATLSTVAGKLSEILKLSQEVEDFIEQKESYLRTLDEARFLINLRMKFDEIHGQFEGLADALPDISQLDRGRSWVAIVASSRSLEASRATARRWTEVYGQGQVAVYLASNGYYAVAVVGDGTFTTAYRLTVKLQQDGAPHAYFASSKDWGQNYVM